MDALDIKIGNRIIGKNQPCYIIAEAGVNHNGDLDLAKKLVDKAKDAGVDAVKFQTFKSEDVCTINAERAEYQKKNVEREESQLEMLKRLELPYEDFKTLKNYCDSKNITFLSTAHTEDAVDFLEDIIPAYKIGSGDLTNIPTLKKIAKKGKPMILGTGMATMDEIKEALSSINEEGNKDIIMLHCTTNYPCPRNEVNLKAMQTMQKELECLIGYSDHTKGIDVSLMAIKLGAVLIEKHFTLDKNMQGPDHKASMNPEELKKLVDSIKNHRYEDLKFDEEILGSDKKIPNKSEKEIMTIIRKSIVTIKDIKKGEKLNHENISIKRPGTGILPKRFDELIGKKATVDILKDKIIKGGDIE